MDIDIPVPPIVKGLEPLFITSPTVRSGTTLLQRLLCSAENVLIFGEHCANDYSMNLQLYLQKLLLFQQRSEGYSKLLQDVLSGKVDGWIPDLMPEIGAYVEACGEGYFGILKFYEAYAANFGRSIWGMKMAGWMGNMVINTRKVIPGSRFVYIYRDVLACVKSAKAQDMIRTEAEIKQFVMYWRETLKYMFQHQGDDRILFIDYREIAEPEKFIRKLEDFTGAKGINREILATKYNAFSHTMEGQYVDPAALTEEEVAMVKEEAGELWGIFGHDVGK